MFNKKKITKITWKKLVMIKITKYDYIWLSFQEIAFGTIIIRLKRRSYIIHYHNLQFLSKVIHFGSGNIFRNFWFKFSIPTLRS